MSEVQNSENTGSNSSTGWAAATAAEEPSSTPPQEQQTPDNPTSSTEPSANPLTTEPETTEPGDETPPAAQSNPLAEGGDEPPASTEEVQGEGDKDAAAPELFDFSTLELPEGLEVREQDSAAFHELAKTHNLTPEAQAALVDMQLNIMKDMQQQGAAQIAAEEQAFAALQAKWSDQVKNDPELGGENLERTWARVGTALDFLAGDKTDEAGKVTAAGYKTDLLKAIQLGGLSNNPHMLRFFHDVAGLITEGTPLSSSNPAGGEQGDARAIWTSMPNA